MNAFNERLHIELRGALDQVEAEPDLRAVILTGCGAAFSAGQDLTERAHAFERGARPDLGDSLERNYNPLIRRIAALPCPIIAAVNGIASGAGAGLALACDIVIAAESARFQFGFVRVALGPDSGVSWHLSRRIGAARALTLLLSGEMVDAEQALSMGLCDQIYPDAKLIAGALNIARRFEHGPQTAIRAIKCLMRFAPPSSLDEALEAERAAQQTLGRDDDYRSAIMAFAAKRSPFFK